MSTLVQPAARWSRGDVPLGAVFINGNGELWRVVGIVEEPSVVLAPADERRRERVSYVISSPLFAKVFPVRLEVHRIGERARQDE